MQKTILILLMLMLITCSSCLAAPSNDNALAAIALYIDTSGHYVPGIDVLNKALNEVIRYKINALFLGSEVQSGNEVLRDLNRLNITRAADATPESLALYAQNRHVNNIILLSVRPLDIAFDLKAYSTAANGFIVDKTITRPDTMEALNTIDALTAMVGAEITEILETIRGS